MDDQKKIAFTLDGIRQLIEWASAYVENETTIPETPRASLTEKERAGLAIIEAYEHDQRI